MKLKNYYRNIKIHVALKHRRLPFSDECHYILLDFLSLNYVHSFILFS